MFYRLTTTLNFPSIPPPDWLRAIKQYVEANCITTNPGQDNSEPSYYIVQKCYHDEQPSPPCEKLDEWQSPN